MFPKNLRAMYEGNMGYHFESEIPMKGGDFLEYFLFHCGVNSREIIDFSDTLTVLHLEGEEDVLVLQINHKDSSYNHLIEIQKWPLTFWNEQKFD